MRCPTCRGDGRMTCGNCDGTTYDYNNEEPCASCDASGTVNCPTCGGTGQVS